MKKLIAILAGVLAFAAVASAQSRAVGVRAGFPVGEVSYQYGLGGNFIEADLGLRFGNGSSIGLTGIYDYVFASTNIFNFYVGPGAYLGFYSVDSKMQFNAGIVGQLGVEAEIPTLPINISLDWKPTLLSVAGSYWDGIAFGIRYRF